MEHGCQFPLQPEQNGMNKTIQLFFFIRQLGSVAVNTLCLMSLHGCFHNDQNWPSKVWDELYYYANMFSLLN